MRLGQLLVESSFITQSELSTALAYAQTKELRIGRCLVLLRMVTDQHVNLALEAQSHVRKGLDAKVATDLMRAAFRDRTEFDKVLITSPNPLVGAYLNSLAGGQGATESEKNYAFGQSAPSYKPPVQQAPQLETLDSLRHLDIDSQLARNSVAGSSSAGSGAPSGMAFSRAKTGVTVDTTKPVQVLIERGDELMKQQQYLAAEASYRAAIEKVQPEPGDVKLLNTMIKLADVLAVQKKVSEFDQLVDGVLKLARRNIKSEESGASKAVAKLADNLGLLGRVDLALQAYLLAGEMFEERLPSSLVDAICNLRAASVISKALPEQAERKRLGDLFLASGLVNQDQLQAALAHSKQAQVPLGSAFEQLGTLKGRQVKSLVHCQMLIQQNILTEPVAIQALRLAARQDMDLNTFLKGANIPPAKENSPKEKELSDCLDNLLGLESKGEGKSIAAGIACLQLGKLYIERNSIFDSEFAFRRAFNVFQVHSKNSLELVQAALGLADALIQQKRRSEAHALLLQAMTSIPSSPSIELAQFFAQLSMLEYEQGATASAYSVARSAVAIMDQIGCTDAKLRFRSIETLVKCADEMGDAASYVSFLSKLLETAKQIPEMTAADLEVIEKKIAAG